MRLDLDVHTAKEDYSAFQHWSNVGARSSLQAINVPMVHPENEIQNMVASQSPEDPGVAYGPARIQKSYAQLQQKSQGLHHQQESPSSTVSTGSQPSILTNTATNFITSADCHSSAHVSVQHSSHFGTSVGYSVRQSVNSGQQRECSKGNLRRFLKGSNLNQNTGLQQRKHLNCAFSTGTNSLKLAQTVPLKVQHSSETLHKTCPLLFDLLSENLPDSEEVLVVKDSEETNANMAFNTVAHVPDKRHHKGRQAGSLAALNCGQTRTQHLHHSGGTLSTPHQQQVLSVGETKPPTNDEIHAIISKKLAYFCNYLTQKKRSDGHSNKELGRNSILQSQLSTTSASKGEDAMIDECSAAVGQYNCLALEEDNSKGNKANAELMHQFNETGDCATSATEKHSTGILVTAVENSKHYLKNKSVEKSALVDFDLSVKKHLDVSMPANSDCKLVYSDDCEDTCIGNDESFHSKWCDKYLENGLTTLNYSLTALKELIASLENVDRTAETENVSKVILQQYWNGKMDNVNLFASTEYPHIMLKVGATCTKNEEESPVVLTAVPGMTWDDRREQQPTLVLNRSSSQEEYKSPSLNSNKNLDDIDQVPGVSWALNHMTERKKGDAALKPVGTVGLDSGQHKVDVAEDPQTKSSSVVSGNGTFGFSSLLNRNAKEKKSIEDQQHAREDAGFAHSQTISMAVPENKLQKHALRRESKVEEAHPLHEDISDNDALQLATELPNKEHLECSSPAYFEVPKYEDISEAESRTESMAGETTLVAAPNDRQSPLENEGYGHVQGQAQMKTETLVKAQYCATSSMSSDEDTTDDETDDEHVVIPVTMVTLTFEPEDEDQDIETNVPSPKRWPSPNLVQATAFLPVQATAFPPVLVFDTPESFLLSETTIVTLDSSTDEHEMDSESDLETITKRRGSSDSGETEDSCDYSSASESNHMTVSKKMRKSLAPVPSRTNDSLSEEESEGYGVIIMPIEAKPGCSKHLQDDVINLDSDTEDESDQKCKKRAKRKRKRLRSSGDRGDALASQQKRHSPETFKDKSPKNRPPSVYSPAPFQVVVQDVSSDSSECTEKSGQRVDAEAASEHVQHKTDTQMISPEQSVIIIDSEDEHAQNDEMPIFLSSGLHNGDDPCVRPESVDGECGPAEEKLQETRPPLADSPQRQSKLRDTQFREATEDACSDRLHSEQLVEARGGSEHVPHKAKRQTTSKRRVAVPDSERVCKKGHFRKRKAVTKRIVSSESEDSAGDDVLASKSRRTVSVDSLWENDAKTKPKKKNVSSEDLPEKQPVMKDANSHLPNNCVIPRYVFKCSGPKGGLKLMKEPVVHKQGNDGTLSPEASTASSKKTESCEKNEAPSYRNKKVRFGTPVPANDENQATKNDVHSNARKPARVSRQLSLPVQEGPSTSFSSSSSTSRPLPVQARRSSVSSSGVYPSEAASRLPYNPRELSFPLNKRRFVSSSTLNHPPSKGPASTMQLNATGNAKEQVNSYHPIKGDRKLREDNVRPERSHHDRASDERAPRKRPSHPKPATILMKRATNDAKLLMMSTTKAINRVSHKERRDSVGDGYKWSEKPTVAKSTKGSSREKKMGRSPPRPYL